MSKQTEITVSHTIIKIIVSLLTALLISAIIGGIKASHDLTEISTQLDAIEQIANEKITAQTNRLTTYIQMTEKRFERIEKHTTYLERRLNDAPAQ